MEGVSKRKKSLVYLIGNPGVGKYSISKELEKYGYVIFDNQLYNIPVLSVINNDGFDKIPPEALKARKQIRNILLRLIKNRPAENYVFTNALYNRPEDKKLFNKIKKLAWEMDLLFYPIYLDCSLEENKRRIQIDSRRDRLKSTNVDLLRDDFGYLSLNYKKMMGVTEDTPHEVCKNILWEISFEGGQKYPEILEPPLLGGRNYFTGTNEFSGKNVFKSI